jgi:hypothetical protein
MACCPHEFSFLPAWDVSIPLVPGARQADDKLGEALSLATRVQRRRSWKTPSRSTYCAEEIAYEYPGITFADVYAALAYYFDNPEEIQAEFRNDEKWAAWMKANIPSKPREKLRG